MFYFYSTSLILVSFRFLYHKNIYIIWLTLDRGLIDLNLYNGGVRGWLNLKNSFLSATSVS